VARAVGRQALERLDVGLEGDDERVAVRAKRSGYDVGDVDSGLARQRRRQRLVLDLLEPAYAHASRWIPIGERAPQPGYPLGVLRIPSENAHPQRLSVEVVPDVLGRADVLLCRRLQVGRFHAQRHER